MEIDHESWAENGYYILPKLYSDAEINAAKDAQWNAWNAKAPRIVVDDLTTGKRLRMEAVSDGNRERHRFKINDLYLELPAIRALAMNSRITPVLTSLLGHVPVLCNSLSFERGSTQPDHVDALFMTPRTVGHLIAIWVALEDCHADAGPLRYYPGSQKIPPYRFSSGSYHFSPEEMPAWNAYMRSEVSSRSLAPTTFAAKKGDVFIWNAHLLHGGSEIQNPTLTRKSLVFHYYSEADARAQGSDLVLSGNGGHWMYRQHQPVAGDLGEYPPLDQEGTDAFIPGRRALVPLLESLLTKCRKLLHFI